MFEQMRPVNDGWCDAWKIRRSVHVCVYVCVCVVFMGEDLNVDCHN